MIRPVRVELNDKLHRLAVSVGLQRQAENRRCDQPDHRVLHDPLAPDVNGAIGELAVAVALKLPWTGRFVPHDQWLSWRHSDGSDVGDRIQVRTTPHHRGRLILHEKDADELPYVFVRLYERTAYIWGWIYGAAGKRRGVWEDVGHGRPCFYVDPYDLWDLSSLPGLAPDADVEAGTLVLV